MTNIQQTPLRTSSCLQTQSTHPHCTHAFTWAYPDYGCELHTHDTSASTCSTQEHSHFPHTVCTRPSLMYRSTINKHLHATERGALELFSRPCTLPSFIATPHPAAHPNTQWWYTHIYPSEHTHTCSLPRMHLAGTHIQEEPFDSVVHLKEWLSRAAYLKPSLRTIRAHLTKASLRLAAPKSTKRTHWNGRLCAIVDATAPPSSVVSHRTRSNTLLCSALVMWIQEETPGVWERRWFLYCDAVTRGQSWGKRDPLLLVPLDQWFSTGKGIVPPGDIGDAWRHFWLLKLWWGRYYWH